MTTVRVHHLYIYNSVYKRNRSRCVSVDLTPGHFLFSPDPDEHTQFSFFFIY